MRHLWGEWKVFKGDTLPQHEAEVYDEEHGIRVKGSPWKSGFMGRVLAASQPRR